MKRVVLMNAPVATVPGVYEFTLLTLDEAADIILNSVSIIESYIGHQGTADAMTSLFGVPIPVNRAMYRHEVGDVVIVFRLLQRQPEGAILTAKEVNAIGYEFALFNRIA